MRLPESEIAFSKKNWPFAVKLHRTAIHLVLSLMLLLSQQLGMLHAVSHFSTDAATRVSSGKQLPSEMRCEQCLAFASIGSALTNPPFTWVAVLAAVRIAVAVPSEKCLPSTICAFDPRAPPVALQASV